MGNLLALFLFLFPSSSLFAFEGVEFRLRPHQIPKDYGPRDVQAEIEFGRNLGGIILKRHSLYPDRELQKYVNLVGNGIAELMGRPELPIPFRCHRYRAHQCICDSRWLCLRLFWCFEIDGK